ncbi:exosome nuclease subunit, partial [Coelomomyces lativittatus]
MTESNNQSFAALQKQLLHDLFKFTKATTAFEPESLLIHKAEKPTFAEELNKFTEKDLEFFNQLVTFVSSPSQKIVPFKNADDIQERWINVIEAIDTGLELADMALDRVYGRIPDAPSSHLTSIHGNGAHFPSTPSSSSFSSSSSNPSPSPQAMLTTVKHANVSIQVVHANQIVRSQELFKEDVDNSLTRPFIPKLKSKLCSQVPLPVYPTSEHEIKEYNVDHLFPHPYQYEIENLNYPPFLFESVSESPLELPVGLDVSEMEWIDTVEGLEKLIEEIKNEPYIAVDLEHHSYRSYQGFLCLMQITSSHHKDYLVDTLALRMELHQLNRIFADPNILKIFHGADYDIIWLQRDLGCYVVNLFDTFHASKVLQFPTHSLAYLLQHFCQIKTDKKYQLADWRLRPLPQEMVLYARMDTHYLIYIFQKLRQLLSADQLQVVLQKSKDVSLKVHTKWNYDAESGLGRYGWAQLYAKTNRPLDPLRFSVFKHLHQWRDLTAREYDESTGYVLPNSMLLSIATRLPTTTKD